MEEERPVLLGKGLGQRRRKATGWYGSRARLGPSDETLESSVEQCGIQGDVNLRGLQPANGVLPRKDGLEQAYLLNDGRLRIPTGRGFVTLPR